MKGDIRRRVIWKLLKLSRSLFFRSRDVDERMLTPDPGAGRAGAENKILSQLTLIN